MKRLLVFFLLVANLFSGLAFAWDTHPEALVGHDKAKIDMVAGTGGNHDHPNGDIHHGDHCCHGAAHLVGMFSSHTIQVTECSRTHLYPLVVVTPSLYITPLLRPPIT